MWKIERFLVGLVFVFGGAAATSGAQSRSGTTAAQFETTVKEALADSRRLGKTLMPSADELGEGWKYPWQLPERLRQRAPSEDAYWETAVAELPATGLDEAQADALVGLFADQLMQSGAAEGLSRRDALLLLWQQTRRHNIPFSQEILEGLSLAAALYRERARLGEEAANAPSSERQLIAAILKPYGDLDDGAIRAMAAQEISLVKRRMPMTYFRSNDWPGLVASGLDDEKLVEKGLWLAVVEIQLMLLDPNPLTWPPDLTAENAEKMQQRALALFRELLLAETQRRRQTLIADTAQQVAEIDERLQAETSEDGRARLLAQRRSVEEAFETEQQELGETAARVTRGLDIRIYLRDFGEHCHVFKLSGVSPDEVNLEASGYSAWLRNGRAVARIAVGGNLDESTMTRIMDQVLAEMDAKTAAYAGM